MMKRGDRITMEVNGKRLEGVVELASSNETE
jgi:hypothetical protein